MTDVNVLEGLKRRIYTSVREDESNFIEDKINIYDEPIFGVARVDDPLFKKFKENQEIIGEMFRLPEEWLPGAETVISYFLPFSQKVRCSNYLPGPSSIEWLHSRFMGENFNDIVRKLIIKELKTYGGKAVAPLLEDDFIKDFEVYSSNWSERHIAFAAGLGTFSHSRSLITEKGTAGRFGSVITDLKLEPTPRKYSDDDIFAYCLFSKKNKCGKCIDRCPAGAITAEGKDKALCSKHLLERDLMKEVRLKYGYPYSPCGKCQTDVPCEDKIPDL